MTYVEKMRETFHITEDTYKKIMDLMDEVRTEIDAGNEYSLFTFERKMKQIVRAPAGDPEYDYYMVREVAEAFLLDGRWEEVFLTLYKDEPSQKSFIEDWYAKKYGDPQK